jgi:RNA polymerase sigma-70 factor (ECF subfamily)
MIAGVSTTFAELVQAASRGETPAVEHLLQRCLPGLKAFVRLRAGAALMERESHDDLVQSVCREVLQDRGGFDARDEGVFKQWLYTAAARKIADRYEYWRAQKRDAAREQSLPGTRSPSGDAEILACYSAFASPSRQASAREELQRIEQSFARLSDEYRDVIVMSRLFGLSRADIAAQLGKTEIAVKGLLARALSELADLLDVER